MSSLKNKHKKQQIGPALKLGGREVVVQPEAVQESLRLRLSDGGRELGLIGLASAGTVYPILRLRRSLVAFSYSLRHKNNSPPVSGHLNLAGT